MRAKFTDEEIKNKRFGLLKPIEPFYRDKKKYWRCRCECGTVVERAQNYLVSTHRSFRCRNCHKFMQPGGVTGSNHPNWQGYGELSGSYICGLKEGARKRNISFEITIEQAWEQFTKQNGRCNLTGLPIAFSSWDRTKGSRHKQTASLDRINSNEGYVLGNIQWVHKDINRMKSDFGENYFFELCQLVIENQKTRELQLSQSA